MSKNKQVRKVLITINNPDEKGITHEVIKEHIGKLTSTVYYCMSDEIGEKGTPHTHVFIAFRSPVRWSTIQKQFPTAHIDTVLGTAAQTRDYVAKTGKWATSQKKETSVESTFEDFGALPEEQQGRRSDLDYLYQQIKDGASDYEILESNPKYLRHINLIDKARLAVAKEAATTEYRPVTITYIYGDHGVGKTRFVLENYDSLFRVTRYKNAFDNYARQTTIFLDSYYNGFPLGDLLQYTEGYATELDCRYCNKLSNWDSVVIASTKPITDQYKEDQFNDRDAWRAFLRRVTTIIHFLPNDEKVHYKVDDDYNIVPVGLDDTTPVFPGMYNTDTAGKQYQQSEVVAHKSNRKP